MSTLKMSRQLLVLPAALRLLKSVKLRTKTHSLTKTLLRAVGIASRLRLLPFNDTKFGASVACRNELVRALKLVTASATSSASNLGLETRRVFVP